MSSQSAATSPAPAAPTPVLQEGGSQRAGYLLPLSGPEALFIFRLRCRAWVEEMKRVSLKGSLRDRSACLCSDSKNPGQGTCEGMGLI